MVVDPESKRKGIETLVKLSVFMVGAAVAGPYIWMSLEGMVALAAAAGTALVLWAIAPAAATFAANKRIAMLVAVIEANPIETMQNLYADKFDEFKRQESAVTEFDTQFQNVSTLVEDLKKSDPDEAEQYAKMRDKMEDGLQELRAEQGFAQKELDNAHKTIDKMQRIWKVACAMNKALAANASARQQVFDQMKQDVSVDTVRTNLNRAFASLNTAVERRRNQGILPLVKEQASLPIGGEVNLAGPSKKSIKILG